MPRKWFISCYFAWKNQPSIFHTVDKDWWMSHYGLQIFQTTRKPMIVSRVSPNLMGQAVRLMFNPGWIPCVVQSGDASELGLITQWIGWKKKCRNPWFLHVSPIRKPGVLSESPQGIPKGADIGQLPGIASRWSVTCCPEIHLQRAEFHQVFEIFGVISFYILRYPKHVFHLCSTFTRLHVFLKFGC